MKKNFIMMVTALITSTLFLTQQANAQPHQKINYHTLIRNSENALVISSVVGLKISILQGSSTGTTIYTETQTPTTDANGLINIEIGNGVSYHSINWMNGPYFIMTETDPTGGSKYSITSTSQLLNVPLAFDEKYLSLKDTAKGSNIGDMLYWNGTSWAIIPVGQPGQFLQLSSSNVPKWSGITLPGVTTKEVSSIKQTFALCGGNVTNDGGSPVTTRGICYAKTRNPTKSNFAVESGTNTGSFTVNLTGLTPATIYYIKAFATNITGTMYGNEVNFTTSTTQKLTIGQTYQGGIIAYILQPGDLGYDSNEQHGFIAATSDQSSDMQWYNGSYSITGTTSSDLGTGNTNTTTIVSNQGAGSYAAKLCYDLVIGVYSDWYLPSIDELQKLYDNRSVIGGFSIGYYWSSSEYSKTHAWYFSFTYGTSNSSNQNSSAYVRAVRSF